MPITSPDYRWMNLMAKAPGKAMPRIVRRLAEGLGGMAVGREYVATGQALQAGIYRALLDRAPPRGPAPTWQSWRPRTAGSRGPSWCSRDDA